MRHGTIFATSVSLLVGCVAGDNFDPPACSVQLSPPSVYSPDPVCSAVQHEVGLVAPTIVVEQALLDRYYDRYARAVAAEPLMLIHREAQERWAVQTASIGIVNRWLAGHATANIAEFDTVMHALGARFRPDIANDALPDFAEWRFNLGIDIKRLFGRLPVAKALSSSRSSLIDVTQTPASSSQRLINFAWPSGAPPGGSDDDMLTIEYTLTGPGIWRQLLAEVTATTVQVYDLGGLPLPPGVHLAPTTIPRPR
jgi:hypothetical protein